jgi:hypothetical protein
MAKARCRDCSRCTESAGTSCLMAFPRMFIELFLMPKRMFQRKCPLCGHPLSWHEKDASGRFKD